MHRNTKADTKEDEDVDAAVEEDTAEDADEPIIRDNKIPKSVKTIIKAEDNSKQQGTKHHQTTNSVKGFTTNQLMHHTPTRPKPTTTGTIVGRTGLI